MMCLVLSYQKIGKITVLLHNIFLYFINYSGVRLHPNISIWAYSHCLRATIFKYFCVSFNWVASFYYNFDWIWA